MQDPPLTSCLFFGALSAETWTLLLYQRCVQLATET